MTVHKTWHIVLKGVEGIQLCEKLFSLANDGAFRRMRRRFLLFYFFFRLPFLKTRLGVQAIWERFTFQY